MTLTMTATPPSVMTPTARRSISLRRRIRPVAAAIWRRTADSSGADSSAGTLWAMNARSCRIARQLLDLRELFDHLLGPQRHVAVLDDDLLPLFAQHQLEELERQRIGGFAGRLLT